MRFTRWAAALALLPLAASAQTLVSRGSAEDVRLRTAAALSEQQRPFSAAQELLGLAGGLQADRLPEVYQWQLAQTLLDAGQRDAAQEVYRGLALTTQDIPRYVAAQLTVAEHDFKRGRLDQALRVLDTVEPRLNRAQRLDWLALRARVLLAQGRYGEAATLLAELDTSDQQSAYIRYNLGIALINDGRHLQGRDTLDRVGRMVVRSVEDQALRDKANLTLGWHFLQNEQGGTAKAIFQRVRVEGPFSNRALLGLGWAELAPRGSRQERGRDLADEDPFANFSTLGGLLRPGFLERDVYQRAGFRNFRLGSIASDEEEALRRALAAWVELIQRDPLDPAVQEGWLAIPYSLDKLGAHTQALQYYERAIAELEANRARMRTAMTSLESGRMVETLVRRDLAAETGRRWQVRDLPDAQETYYLQTLLAEHRFQEGLKNYRDLRQLALNLDAWADRLQQVEQAARTQPRPFVEPEELFRRARHRVAPQRAEIRPRLRAETRLAAPGRYQAALVEPAMSGTALRLSEIPQRFSGPYETTLRLQGELVVLRAQVEAAATEQRSLLTRLGREELEGQLATIERYLVEARFALARLYDRRLRGDF